MVEEIAGRAVRHGEVHGEGAEAAVRGQPEGRVLVEHLTVQVDADVGLHVLRAVVKDLQKEDLELGIHTYIYTGRIIVSLYFCLFRTYYLLRWV